jgi:integrase
VGQAVKAPRIRTNESRIRIGSIEFRVWKFADGRVAFDYHDGSKRKVVRKTTLAKLRAAAETVAISLANAETAALDLTAEDRRIYIAARHHLRPIGIAVDAMCRDAAEAAKITPGVPLVTLARFYAGHHPGVEQIPPTGELLARMIADLTECGRSEKYLRDLRRDLAKFAAQCPDLTAATDEDIRAHLRSLPVGPRRRDNIRDGIVRLFRYAREKKFLAENRRTVAEAVVRLKPGTEVTTYTPTEIRALLEHIEREWIPWMAIAAFAGLRTSEIFRLQWSSVKWGQSCIAVPRKVARKVRISRLVPLPENLARWLAPWRDATGPLYPHESWKKLEYRHLRAIGAVCEATGIQWRNNALRHSYGSHRLAVVKSFAQVAMEMGNSEAKVREHYNDPKPEAEAHDYFSITPPDLAANVLQLPLGIRFGG